MDTFRADVLQTISISDLEAPQQLKGQLVLKKPDKFSVEYSKPKQQVKCNGKNVWIYMQEENQVIVQDLKEFKAKENILFGFNSFTERLKSDFVNVLIFKNSAKNIVEVESVPKNDAFNLSRIRFTIDTLKWLPLKITVYYSDNNYISVAFTKPLINEKLKQGFFEFKIPEDATIINQPLQ